MLIRKQNLYITAILCVFFITTGCKTTAQAPSNAASSQIQISKDMKWSDRMALSIMKRHPESYMIDDSKSPKWDYVRCDHFSNRISNQFKVDF